MNSVGIVASIGFLVSVGFWFLLPFLAFWFLLTVGFGFYWLCACVGYSTYGRVTRNYRELLVLGLRWLKVIFVSFFLLLLWCCCWWWWWKLVVVVVVEAAGAACLAGAQSPAGGRSAAQPPSSLEISMIFFGFVVVSDVSCCLL